MVYFFLFCLKKNNSRIESNVGAKGICSPRAFSSNHSIRHLIQILAKPSPNPPFISLSPSPWTSLLLFLSPLFSPPPNRRRRPVGNPFLFVILHSSSAHLLSPPRLLVLLSVCRSRRRRTDWNELGNSVKYRACWAASGVMKVKVNSLTSWPSTLKSSLAVR